jgi:predicted MPP superfamily phosphohydrolase
LIEYLPAVAATAYLSKLLHYGIFVEPNRIELTHHSVPLRGLPQHLDGFTLCQISDLHIGPKPRNEQAVAALLKTLQPNLWVLTGDMIYRQEGIHRFAEWWDSLGGHCMPAAAVLGNAEHKSYVQTSDLVKVLEDRGILLLNNRAVQLHTSRGALQIVGVDDPHTRHSRFAEAYAEADPKAFTLLLCHSPDGAAERRGCRADLMLCGHTHGGQIRLKLLPALQNTNTVRELLAGWYCHPELTRRSGVESSGVRMYISRGTGTNRIPIRIGCPPEIALFRLCREDAESAPAP